VWHFATLRNVGPRPEGAKRHAVPTVDAPAIARRTVVRNSSRTVGTRTYKGLVFVADDEATFRGSIQDALEDRGYLVLSARNGTEALARMYGFHGAALAIVDLNMPGMNGWELIATMRAHENLAGVRILVVSSHAGEPIEGVDRLLQKPLKLKDLLRTVEELTV
jgi:CheY-like chemotaxis protein